MPRITEYVRPDVIAQVQRLDLRARFIVEGFYAGLHASPYQGFSVEFSEHRKYVPGDDLRTIDWNVYAKTDRFYVKQYRAETNLSAYLLMDTSASMAFPRPDQIEPGGAPRMSKFDYASCLAAALAYLMIHQQDAVGLALLGARAHGQSSSFVRGTAAAPSTFLPPRSRRAQLSRLLTELVRTQPAGPTDLVTGLHDVARRTRRRSLMILFSDLLCERTPLIEALRRLRFGGHDLIVFCVLDAAEAGFPFRGPTRFEDVEHAHSLTTDADVVRDAYLAELQSFLATLRDATAAMRADFIQIDTSMTFDQALARFLVSRRRRF